MKWLLKPVSKRTWILYAQLIIPFYHSGRGRGGGGRGYGGRGRGGGGRGRGGGGGFASAKKNGGIAAFTGNKITFD